MGASALLIGVESSAWCGGAAEVVELQQRNPTLTLSMPLSRPSLAVALLSLAAMLPASTAAAQTPVRAREADTRDRPPGVQGSEREWATGCL